MCKCSLPGQHPEEDDTLVSGGLSKDVGWRRGLIVSLEETVFTLVSDVDEDVLAHCFLRSSWLRSKRPLTI